MLRPPGLYPNAYGKAPPAMECVNGPVIPTTAKVESEVWLISLKTFWKVSVFYIFSVKLENSVSFN